MSEMASANITAYVTVGECGAMLIMYIYVTVAMGRILWRMFKRRKDVASNFTPTLIFHIFMWFVAAITGIVCNAYTVLAFNLDKPYPIMLFFWTNIPNFSTIFAAITAGIFLVIDRICMVTIKPARYIHVKTPLLILDVAFVVGTLIAGMAFYLISGAKEENDYCWNMACAINQFGVSFTILYRYILEVVYTLLGLLCLWLLRRFNRRVGKILQTNGNLHKGEAIVKFTIYTNIFVETIPLFIGYLFMDILKIPVQNYIGAFTRVFAIINGSICAWKYTTSLKMADASNVSSQRVGNQSRSGTMKTSKTGAR